MKTRIVGTITASLVLSACNIFGPSTSDIAKIFEVPESNINDLSCAEAVGEPGYVCSFVVVIPPNGMGGVLGSGMKSKLTRRFVKADAGGWRMY